MKKENTDVPSSTSERPWAEEDNRLPWHIGRVPNTIKIEGKRVIHPARTCAVFVVHGMGEQLWTQTSTQLRSGFEDALKAIEKWQRERALGHQQTRKSIPPPFVYDGYWADYPDLEKTFPEDWKRFNERERKFFHRLWQLRALSIQKTYLWFIKQQLRLLHPAVLKKVGAWAWLLYFPLQIVSIAALTFALIRHPKLITGFLSDVRLYLDPQGMVEEAIVQRIDYRVGKAFLRMVGLDWDFNPLPEHKHIEVSGKRIVFKRIIWVAHSLGTVIIYNVLSTLFHRAAILEHQGNDEQKKGVERFRVALRRFVTMGSPLDKVAYLFKDRSLRPWPEGTLELLQDTTDNGPKKSQPQNSREWWINFYHMLDPVSGALSNELICANEPPINYHIRSGFLPGLAHIAYWKDISTLRFILSRTYGKKYIPDKEYRSLSAQTLSAIATFIYLLWASILIAGAYLIIKLLPKLITLGLNRLFGQ